MTVARKPHLLVAFSVFLLGAVFTPAPAAAAVSEADKASAQENYQRGKRLYQVARYKEALDAFTEAFLLADDPALLFNIAQCHRQLGQLDDALTFYRRFLRESPDSPVRVEVEKQMREVEAQRDRDSAAEPAPKPPLASPPPPAAALPPPESDAAAAAISLPPPAQGEDGISPWIWVGAGAAVVAGVVVTVLLLSGGSEGGCGGGVEYCLPVESGP